MPSDARALHGLIFHGQWKSGKKLHRLSRHKNPGLEIVLVTKGQLRWEVEGREAKLGAEMLFYTLPWQAHGGVEELQPSSEISYLCLALNKAYTRPRSRFRFDPALGFSPEEQKAVSRALTRGARQALPADEESVWLFDRFFQVVQGSGPFRASRLRNVLRMLVLNLARLAATENIAEPSLGEAERRVRRFTQTLPARHAEPWTLATMSRSCGLSRTHFAQLLKKQTGDTPINFLNRARVAMAQRLIGQSNKSITEIALEVGFNSSQYFATVFKEFTDRSAREFRRREKSASPAAGTRSPGRAGKPLK